MQATCDLAKLRVCAVHGWIRRQLIALEKCQHLGLGLRRARVFVQGPYFRTLVAESRRDDILDQTFEAAEQLDASWVFITDASGMLVAKSDEPSASGDQLANVALISGALRGQVMTGFGGSGDSALFQATAVPVAAPGGSPFGVLVATRLLDSAMAVDIATATPSGCVPDCLPGYYSTGS